MQKLSKFCSLFFKGTTTFLLGTILVIVVGLIGLFVCLGLETPKKFPEKAKQSFFSHKSPFEELRQMISSEPLAYCISDEHGQLSIGPYFYDGNHWRLAGDITNKAFSMQQVGLRMEISQERFAEYRKLLKQIDFQSVHKNLISDNDLPYAGELQSPNSSIPDKVYLQKLIHAKPDQLFISFRSSPRTLPSYIDYIPNNHARPSRYGSAEQRFEQLENHWFLEP